MGTGEMTISFKTNSICIRKFKCFKAASETLTVVPIFFSFQSQWLLEPLLSGKLPVMSDVPDQLHEYQTTQCAFTNHQNLILFFSSLVNEILSSADDSSFLASVSLPRSDLVRLWLEMSWVRQWCSCVLGYSDMAEVSDLEQLSLATKF